MHSSQIQTSFDEILENRLGAGKYQWTTLLILCMVDMNDGVELLSMSLIVPIIKIEWQISNFWIQVLSSIFYLGMMIGAMITGKIADKKGRKNAILFASLIQLIVGVSFSLINSLFLLVVFRFIYGFVYGFSLPLTTSMVCEIFPLKFRGKCIIFTSFCISIGKVYAIFLAYMILTDFQTGNWKLLMVISSLSTIFVIIGLIFFVKESPRFLIAIQKFKEAFEIIDHIGIVNKGYNYKPLTEKEKNGLENYQKVKFDPHEQASVSVLFNKKLLGITLRLWVIWFSLLFYQFGSLVILPFIFGEQKKGFGSIMLAIAGELPSVFLSFLLIDLNGFGRKNSLTICCFITSLFNFLAYFAGNSDFFLIILSLTRFFMKTCFLMLMPLTSEIYPTNCRTVGYGYATSAGRFAATICPYLLLNLYVWDIYSSFIFFAGLMFVSGIASYTMNYDTSGKFLDTVLEEEMISFPPS